MKPYHHYWVALFSLACLTVSLSALADNHTLQLALQPNAHRINVDIYNNYRIKPVAIINLYIIQGGIESIVVNAPQQLFHKIHTRQHSEQLAIDIASIRPNEIKKNEHIDIYITCAIINDIQASGNANLVIGNLKASDTLSITAHNGIQANAITLQSPYIELQADNTSRIHIDTIEADSAKLTAIFASHITIDNNIGIKQLLATANFNSGISIGKLLAKINQLSVPIE